MLPLLIAIIFIIIFGVMSFLLGQNAAPGQDKVAVSDILRNIFIDGLPSLVSIVIISVIIEATVRKRERRSIKESFNRVFQNQVGFEQYIYPYKDMALGIEKMLTDVDEYNIGKVRMLFVGIDQEGVKPVINILNRYGFSNYKLELLALNPESDLATSRGQALKQNRYKEHISSNLDSMMSYFRDIDGSLLKKTSVTVKLYDNASKSDIHTLPSVLMVQFGELFIAYSPLWNNKNVKNGSMCFVPKESSMFADLVSEYDGIEQLSSPYQESLEEEEGVQVLDGSYQ